MKKAFVIGMVLVSTLSAQTSFAVVAKTPVDVIREYKDSYKKQLEVRTGKLSAKSKETSLITSSRLVADDAAIFSDSLSIKSVLDGNIRIITSGNVKNKAYATTRLQARLNSLTSIIAAKRLSKEASKVDRSKTTVIEQAESIGKIADVSASLIGNAMFHATPEQVTAKPELAVVRDALLKVEDNAIEITSNFSVAERNKWIEVVELTNKKAQNSANLEEAFIQAIIETTTPKKTLTREQAIEIAKKLKECV